MNKIVRIDEEFLSDADADGMDSRLPPGEVGTSSNHAVLIVHPDDVAALAEQLEEERLFNMASYIEEDTGVKNTIWASHKGRTRHAARIKVAIDPPTSLNDSGENASFTIHDGRLVAGDAPGWLCKQVAQFIELNRAALMDHWEGLISSTQLGKRLQRIV